MNGDNEFLTYQTRYTDEAAAVATGLGGLPVFATVAERDAWLTAVTNYNKLGTPIPVPPPPAALVANTGIPRPGLPVGYPVYVVPPGSSNLRLMSVPRDYKATAVKLGTGEYAVWWGLMYVGSATHRKTARRVARDLNNLMAGLGLATAIDLSGIQAMLGYILLQGSWPQAAFAGFDAAYNTV